MIIIWNHAINCPQRREEAKVNLGFSRNVSCERHAYMLLLLVVPNILSAATISTF